MQIKESADRDSLESKPDHAEDVAPVAGNSPIAAVGPAGESNQDPFI